VLSARLKELETHGLVDRQVAAGPPVRVTYELTGRGRGFGEVAIAIERWGRCLDTAGKPHRKTNVSAPASARRGSSTTR
jgi:DNA-binding HxlR family transcriptional regulator